MALATKLCQKEPKATKAFTHILKQFFFFFVIKRETTMLVPQDFSIWANKEEPVTSISQGPCFVTSLIPVVLRGLESNWAYVCLYVSKKEKALKLWNAVTPNFPGKWPCSLAPSSSHSEMSPVSGKIYFCLSRFFSPLAISQPQKKLSGYINVPFNSFISVAVT